MIELVHQLVGEDGQGLLFEVVVGGREYISGRINSFGELVVGSWSCGGLDAAGVRERAEAWCIAVEAAELHAQCFLWKLPFLAVLPDGEKRYLTWYIWAPTAEVAHERLLGEMAAGLMMLSDSEKVVYDVAIKARWVRA